MKSNRASSCVYKKKDIKYIIVRDMSLPCHINTPWTLPALCFSLSGTMLCHGLDQEGHYKLIHQEENEGESSKGQTAKPRSMKYNEEPEACWIKVEFLRSSVRNWSDPWLQRWTKIFST